MSFFSLIQAQLQGNRPRAPSRELPLGPPPPYSIVGQATICRKTQDHVEQSAKQFEYDYQSGVFITKLPEDLLLKIINLLPLESQGAFVLTNRYMLSVIGNDVFQSMDRVDRDSFLRLLDRDFSFLVYCPPCERIHGPTASGSCKAYTNALTRSKPYTLSPPKFNMIHAVMRSYRAGRGYTELIPGIAAGWPRVGETLGRCLERGFVTTNFLVAHAVGNLVMQTRYILPPAVTSSKTATMRTMYEIGWVVLGRAGICAHHRWHAEYPFLLPNMRHFNLGGRFDVDEAATFRIPAADFHREIEVIPDNKLRIDEQLRCALFHPLTCTCAASREYWGIARSCAECDTDFCLGVAAHPDDPVDRFLVFASWKNLGVGDTREDPIWRGHVQHPDKRGNRVRRSSPEMMPYCVFQGGEVGRAAVYPPEVGRRDAKVAHGRR